MDPESTITDAPAETLVTRRSKRSTAGNRMVAALAEIGMDELTKDPEEDADFVNDKVEEDVFGSDFESTDEEAEKEAEFHGETEAAREERSTKKTARTRLERITAVAHARNRQTFNPDIQIAAKAKSKAKGAKTVRLGTVVDAETGQAHEAAFLREANVFSHPGQQRTSKRKHTVQSTTATATRVQQSQARRAALPKKTKAESRKLSQAELIAAALDTEEGNIIEHRDFLKNEEEKRKRARVVRTTISGPVLRWVSKSEEIKVPVPPPPPPATSATPFVAPIAPTLPALYRGLYGQPYNYTTGTTSFSPSTSSIVSTFPAGPGQSTTSLSPYSNYLASATPSFPIWPPPTLSSQATHTSTFSITSPPLATSNNTPTTATSVSPPPTTTSIANANPTASASVVTPPLLSQPEATTIPVTSPPTSNQEVPAASTSVEGQEQVSGEETGGMPAASEPEPEFKTETVTKNYLIHELDQQKSAPKPTWTQSMTAIFGDHVKWDQVKVFVGKQRPLHRPRQTCPITGSQARYIDPRTGVPYADSRAYKVLTSLLNHEYVWNPSLGCYTNHELPSVAQKEQLSRNSESAGDAMDVDS